MSPNGQQTRKKLLHNSEFLSLKRSCNSSRDFMSLQSFQLFETIRFAMVGGGGTVLQPSSQQTRSYSLFNIIGTHIQMKKNTSSKAGQRLLTLSCRWLWASVCRYRLARQECSSSATANTPLCKYFQHGYEPYDSDRAFQQCFYRCNHKWLVCWKK